MSEIVVIYHGTRCLDGFGAAYAAWYHFQFQQRLNVRFVAASHGDPLPDALGNCRVYLLDFAYKRPLMVQLCQIAAQVVVLDHHISAQLDLAGLDQEFSNLELHFDMNRSGAVITWEYFHRDPPPFLLTCIQDRDLWRFEIADSRHINAALMSYPYEFSLWQRFAKQEIELQALVQEGRAINRFRAQMIEQYRDRVTMGTVAGFRVPIVNAPLAIMSELLNDLAAHQPFAAGYSDKGAKRSWSLRSQEDGMDVADIAMRFGGGGHPRAAGFATQIQDPDVEVRQPPE